MQVFFLEVGVHYFYGVGSLSQPVIGYKMDLKPMLCYFNAWDKHPRALEVPHRKLGIKGDPRDGAHDL